MTRRTVVALLGVVAVAVIAAAAWVGIDYGRDMRAAQARIAGGQVIETAAGPVEYAEQGSGPPILVIHGAAGGCDQGLLIGEMLLPDGYRMIAPSRFGYLGGGLPADTSLEAQADAFAALLDELGVDDPVPVIGFSAGGPSALTFAMRYPERTSALLMMSAISYTEPPSDAGRAGLESAINRLVASDLGFWLAVRFAKPQVAALLGVPKSAQERLTKTGWEDVDRGSGRDPAAAGAAAGHRPGPVTPSAAGRADRHDHGPDAGGACAGRRAGSVLQCRAHGAVHRRGAACAGRVRRALPGRP